MQELQFIYGKSTNGKQLREVKCKLPVNQIVALHSLKILKGRTVSEIVSEALQAHFAVGQEAAIEA